MSAHISAEMVTGEQVRAVIWSAQHGTRAERRKSLAQLQEYVYVGLLLDARQAGITPDLSRPKDDPLSPEQWQQLCDRRTDDDV